MICSISYNGKFVICVVLTCVLIRFVLFIHSCMCQGARFDFYQRHVLTHEPVPQPCMGASSSPFVPQNAAENIELSRYLTLHDIESSWTGVMIQPSLWHNTSGTSQYTICHITCN